MSILIVRRPSQKFTTQKTRLTFSHAKCFLRRTSLVYAKANDSENEKEEQMIADVSFARITFDGLHRLGISIRLNNLLCGNTNEHSKTRIPGIVVNRVSLVEILIFVLFS